MKYSSYYIKSLYWLFLDTISTLFVLFSTFWIVGENKISNFIFIIISVMIRIVVWASSYLPFEYYYSWTPATICMNDNDF